MSFDLDASAGANLVKLAAFTLATSLGWDLGRAVTTALLVAVTGPVLLRTLRRAARKASFELAQTIDGTRGGGHAGPRVAAPDS